MAAQAVRMLAAALAAALLFSPLAAAHLDRERPHIQASEARRDLTFTQSGSAGLIDLSFTLDPLRDSVSHVVDPTKGTFESSYRENPSDASTAFTTRWSWVQFVEFRDANADGVFVAGVDPVVHSWKPSSYSWNVTPPRSVAITGQAARDMIWNGTVSGGPRFLVEAASLGVATIDEGARIRPQDYIVYLDLSDFPARQVGSLYAMEWRIAPAPNTETRFDQALVDNETVVVGARVENPTRLAFFDWGAQATLDDEEAFVNATLGSPDENGNRTLFMNFPRFDRTLHMVWVLGIEYETPLKRGAPGFEAAALVAVFALLAAWTRRPLKRGR